MKLIDKLKNVFFEEVEEDEEELPQTFAKKVEIPKKNVEVPKKEVEIFKREEKIPLEEEQEINVKVEPSIVEEETKEKAEKEFPMMFDDDDFLEDKAERNYQKEEPTTNTIYRREAREYNDDLLYQGKKEVSYIESVNNKKEYSYTKSYYEEKETKGFKPSPIISPIYGILDKNYHKEEVVTKRETRVSSGYNKLDLDSVRNKAFGQDEEVPSTETKKKVTKQVYEDNKKIYDVNNNKPQVNKVTLADADEYYNDLGLAYNEDYSDASRNTGTRTAKYNVKDKKKEKNSVDDNLFDLIDSMYNKED